MKKPKQALRRQRANKKSKKTTFKIKLILACLGFGALTFAAYKGFVSIQPYMQDLFASLTDKPKTKWTISIVGGLSEVQKQKLEAYAQKMFHEASDPDMEILSRKFQSVLGYESVAMVRVGPQSVVIGAQPRVAVLSISLPKGKGYISASGNIFKLRSAPKDMPNVQGILTPSDQLTWKEEGTLRLTPKYQKQIGDVLSLYKMLQKSHILVKTLTYIPYRGFSYTTQDHGTVVIIGFSPYEEKIKKYTSLVDSMKKAGRLADRIELDYNKKAFIKERTL